jgi:hypothetical protein
MMIAVSEARLQSGKVRGAACPVAEDIEEDDVEGKVS